MSACIFCAIAKVRALIETKKNHLGIFKQEEFANDQNSQISKNRRAPFSGH